jgi:hypothetical protein
MSRGLAEQIALLDGLDGNFIQAQDQINASNGGNWSGGSNYEGSIPLMTSSIGLAGLAGDQDVINQYNAINASNGANYSGGANYEGSIPLMTSSIGLAGDMNGFADSELLAYANGYGQIPNTLPERMNVLDASGGANYSGGASFSPGLPLLPSRAGLAAWPSGGTPAEKLASLKAKITRLVHMKGIAFRAGQRAHVDRFMQMIRKAQQQILAIYRAYPGLSPWRR